VLEIATRVIKYREWSVAIFIKGIHMAGSIFVKRLHLAWSQSSRLKNWEMVLGAAWQKNVNALSS
jgi:endonuclease/exonuclease/phosphatase family metal-dependent hydrolase